MSLTDSAEHDVLLFIQVVQSEGPHLADVDTQVSVEGNEGKERRMKEKIGEGRGEERRMI